jgi:integrase
VSTIEKQPNGRWRARYRDRNNRSRSKSFDRKIDARQFLDDVSTDMRRGDWIDPRAGRILFEDWAARWWTTTTKLRPTTRRGYWGILNRQVLPPFTGRQLAQIDYMDVEIFIADRIGTGLSAKYVRECVSVISLIFKSAVKVNIRRDNPAAGHNIPLQQRKLHEGDVLTMEQVHRLVEHVREPYKAAVWLLLLAGLRPAELCGLRVCDVDFSTHVVHVAQTLLPIHGFDGEGFQLVTGPPKTAAGDRRIPIPEWLCTELATIITARADNRDEPTQPAEPLFQTRYGNPLNRDKLRENVIRPALRAAGLPGSFRTYDLRHSHASLLIDLGANILALAQRMGHSDPSVTLRIYGHLFEGAQLELSNQLDELRASKAPETPSAPVVPLVPDPTRIAPVVRHRPNSKRCLAVDTGGVRRSSDRTKDGTTPLNGN